MLGGCFGSLLGGCLDGCLDRCDFGRPPRRGRPGRRSLFLLRQKSKQKKATADYCPSDSASDYVAVASDRLRAGGGPAAAHFFCFAKKSKQKKATADYCPSGSQTACAGRGKHANSLRSNRHVSYPLPAHAVWQQSQAEFESEKQSLGVVDESMRFLKRILWKFWLSTHLLH